jgi:hypothetical protein
VSYAWACEYRIVNLEENGFLFAAAAQVSRLMVEFERNALADVARRWWPRRSSAPSDPASRLAGC